jgi:sterol desaturase/sphingolipid hydroxylase (fatty acid hydroxylase superfamily)
MAVAKIQRHIAKAYYRCRRSDALGPEIRVVERFGGAIHEAVKSLRIAAELLAYSAVFFGFIALLVKGREAIDAARRAVAEVRFNVTLYLLDAVFVAPMLAIAVTVIRSVVKRYSLGIVSEDTWAIVGQPATFVAVVFAGDLFSYWRHRLEHTRWLWPAHAIHHSDTEMTWLTLSRFHPINRTTTTCIDVACLAILGFPAWAMVANELVRHYYGEFIHADLPWMYGPLRRIFVSPVMHRWHHARDVTGTGSNFATVFSVFDRAFGTYYVPGLCRVPLGVTEDVGPGVIRQLLYPFVSWASNVRHAARSSRSSATNPAGGLTSPD